ncbi:MAG: cysteine desulfuration protein SufE [Ponticaulis sp.]|nr:cysteine desulfuration protein SufE [Ponticaulis sp.]
MSVELQATEIRETFDFLDDWEARYEHIIDLGKSLPPLADDEMVDAYKVRGCSSQVWIIPGETANGLISFRAQSDAMIVAGLIALLTELFNNQPAKEVLAFPAESFFAEIGLTEALSSQRANGLKAMLQRIHTLSEAAIQAG